MRREIDELAGRFGAPITRDVPLDDIAFEPGRQPVGFAEVLHGGASADGHGAPLDQEPSIPRCLPPPDGRHRPGRADLDAVLRETLEETGLTVDVKRFSRRSRTATARAARRSSTLRVPPR